MLRPRIVPALLIDDGDLVKTTRFADPRYIGDPINAVRIYNDKEVDELIVLDIGATRNGREPDIDLISRLAAECQMPLCYGGGVRTVEQVENIVSRGVEKVALSSAIFEMPSLVKRASEQVGGQSVVAVLDVFQKGLNKPYELRTHNSHHRQKIDIRTCCFELEQAGVGEIVVNVIHKDGEMNGYDLDLASLLYACTSVPVTMLGGAGSLEDIATFTQKFPQFAAAAGSLFVYKGALRAVLINYPNHGQRENIARAAGLSI